jgi:hypothetical protein
MCHADVRPFNLDLTIRMQAAVAVSLKGRPCVLDAAIEGNLALLQDHIVVDPSRANRPKM